MEAETVIPLNIHNDLDLIDLTRYEVQGHVPLPCALHDVGAPRHRREAR